jgi:hypothetical protein
MVAMLPRVLQVHLAMQLVLLTTRLQFCSQITVAVESKKLHFYSPCPYGAITL